MSAITALFLVGESHPFDGGLNPKFVVKLHEGDRAIWEAISLSDGKVEMASSAGAPELTLEGGCGLVNHLINDFNLTSVGLVVFPGSVIADRRTEISSLLSSKAKIVHAI